MFTQEFHQSRDGLRSLLHFQLGTTSQYIKDRSDHRRLLATRERFFPGVSNWLGGRGPHPFLTITFPYVLFPLEVVPLIPASGVGSAVISSFIYRCLLDLFDQLYQYGRT